MATVTDPKPSVIVIFGITGDLARNKVLPAVYHLYKNRMVDEHTFVVGTSRRDVPAEDVLASLQTSLGQEDEAIDPDAIAVLRSRLSMYTLDPEQPDSYDGLRDYLQSIEDKAATCLERYFYLSIPPQVFGTVVEQLGTHGLQQGCRHGTTTSRLLLEKPFGYDTQSAERLIAQTSEYFEESQLFRIDHYLAKETAQNILTFRQRNPLFNHIWNNRHITRVSITAAEAIGIEGRSNFYDQIGALRDIVQSHLMQLLALTLMEIPSDMGADSIHAAKLDVLQSLQPVPADKVADQAVRGQYAGYRDEVANPTSTTETYASVVLFSQHPDWQGVPFRLTTGKGLKLKRTSITVDLGEPGINRLQFRVQPNEGITLTLQVKRPGLARDVEPTTMNFDYESGFGVASTLNAYERVLIEAMQADHSLFTTSQEVLAAWELLEPVLAAWQSSGDGLEVYEQGSDGPDVTKLSAI